MGIFGSESAEVGTRVVEDTYTKGDSGFGAMGKPVPFYRQEIGYQHCKEMGLTSENAFAVVRMMSEQILRDNPLRAMNEASKYLDVTGIYRLLAVLCTAENPNP